MRKGFIIAIICLITIFISGCGYKPKVMERVGLVSLENSDIIFIQTNEKLIEDNYVLNLQEDKKEYFTNNIVEIFGVIPTSSSSIEVNNKALIDLKEMYNKELYKDLIVRRGYLTEKVSKYQGVDDHETGYDIDFYLDGKEWTDFKGHKEADSLIKNSYKYGFVLRHTDKNNYQPWHFRYVGKIHSLIMYKENLTLVSYLEKLQKLKENELYKDNETNNYIYKVNKNNILIPKKYNYEISSIDENYYIIIFNTNKEVIINENENEKIVEKNITDMNILYDLVLVNEYNKLPNMLNQNLISLTKYLTSDNNSNYVLEEKVLKQLKLMFDDANKMDRNITYVTSAYRNYKEQEDLYKEKEDKSYVAKPNYSEHQTGYSIDISNSSKEISMFHNTYQGLWITNNANKYGFILRYPNNKVDITKISYEPWHFRYVGELHSTYIKENNITLEEYLNGFELNKFYQVEYKEKKYIYVKTKSINNKINTFENIKDIYYISNNEYLSIIEE